MKYRRFGRTGWMVSEIGYGMWGLAGWTQTDKNEVLMALQKAVDLGCNFFDTAWAYGAGVSEEILGDLLRKNPNSKLYAATKVPPKNQQWPSVKGSSIDDVFPNDYILEYVDKSLKNLGLDKIDLLQMHVWEDDWANYEEWKACFQQLKESGKVEAFGVSVNRWEPDNCLDTLRTGLMDAVQVIYNIFDQNPEDHLFPICRELDIGVIARVPFDEGSLTGKLTNESAWPKEDWRNIYFCEENLIPSVDRANALKPLVPDGMTLPELALRFILSNSNVHTTIPGMRRIRHVGENMAASDQGPLSNNLIQTLRQHRWDRVPTTWSM